MMSELMDSAVMPGMQGGPLMHTIAAKAVAFKEAGEPSFSTYQKNVLRNAAVMADAFLTQGDRLVSGGTDNHLMLIDLTGRGMTGKIAENLLGQVTITVNKNRIPFDTKSAFVTSGIRVGTPALTTRGMGEDEMRVIVGLIHRALKADGDEKEQGAIRGAVAELTQAFPLYR